VNIIKGGKVYKLPKYFYINFFTVIPLLTTILVLVIFHFKPQSVEKNAQWAFTYKELDLSPPVFTPPCHGTISNVVWNEADNSLQANFNPESNSLVFSLISNGTDSVSLFYFEYRGQKLNLRKIMTADDSSKTQEVLVFQFENQDMSSPSSLPVDKQSDIIRVLFDQAQQMLDMYQEKVCPGSI